MKIKEKIKKLVLILLLTLSFLQSAPTIQAYAFGGIGIKTEFDSLQGDGKYLGSDYRGNYKLDIEELGITEVPEKAFNFVANAIFNIISFLGFAAAAFFYYAMDFDLAKLLQPQINQIQETLHNGLFTPMLQLAIAGAIILAICKYARRDFVGLLEQLGKVCFIMVLSFLVVSDSAKFLSYSSSVTKSAAVSILTGINDIDVGENVNSYAANAASVLWISLVHEPWKALEFGDYNCTDEDVEFFLTASGSERKERIAEMMDGDKGPFSKNRSAIRVGQGLIILLTVFVKFIVYIAITALYFVFQAIAIFFVLMAPLILLLSLIPGYDFEILGVWTRKIMETQVGVLIITFVIGVMVFFDRALQALASEIGWFIVLLMQIAVCVCLFLLRWQIFTAFNNVQRGVQNPNLLKRQLIRAGNPYSAIEKQYMFRQVRNAMGYKKNKKNEEKDEKNRGGNYKTDSTTTQKVRRPNSSGRNEAQEKYAEQSENGSYYASRDVTDNWRETWANAKPKQRTTDDVRQAQRPITSANSKVVRRRQVLADHILPEQASGRHREPIKLDRGYRRSANDKMEPITVAYEDITDKQTASVSGNVAMLPETKRPVTNAQYVLPDRSSKSNVLAIERNTTKTGPKVSGASFTHVPTRIPREKINPVTINRVKKQLRSGVAEATRSKIMSRPTTEQFSLQIKSQ
jgi:hypothetical protein